MTSQKGPKRLALGLFAPTFAQGLLSRTFCHYSGRGIPALALLEALLTEAGALRFRCDSSLRQALWDVSGHAPKGSRPFSKALFAPGLLGYPVLSGVLVSHPATTNKMWTGSSPGVVTMKLTSGFWKERTLMRRPRQH